MSQLPVVLTIDDDEFIHDIIQEALEDACQVVSIRDGKEALAAFIAMPPDLVICDVEMPGVDGYDVCQSIRATKHGEHVPVLFLSGKDSIEDRLRGFEAGGDDYMTKPFKLPLLVAKVKHLLSLAQQRRELVLNASSASNAAFAAMASMSEMGQLLQVLREINASTDYQMLVDTILSGIGAFGLEGTTRVYTADGPLIYTSKGPASPLDVSVINHMSTMDKIVQFKSRLSISTQRVTILITNLPLDDEDRLGRLRDHLAMLADIADARLSAIAAASTARSQVKQLTDAVTTVSIVLEQLNTDQRENRAALALTIDHVSQSVEKVLQNISMSEANEALLLETLRTGFDQIVEAHGSNFSGQRKLSLFLSELQAELKWADGKGSQ